MVVQQRARSIEAKRARAEKLLDTLESLLREQSFAVLNVADVAKRAGVAKGTVFTYFATKETMGLALMQRELAAWLAALDSALQQLKAPVAPAAVAGLVVETLAGRDVFVHLLSILGSILEQNIDAVRALEFKMALLRGLSPAGAHLERVLPFLGEGGGLAFLLTLNALVIGLHQMAGPAPVVQEVLRTPELAAFRVDFAAALRQAVEAHLEGLRVLHSPQKVASHG